VTDRRPARDRPDTPRPKRGRRSGPRDSARVAENEAATRWPCGTESSYSAVPPTGRPSARRDADDAPLEVRIEFVQLDGPEGRALRRRQAQIMRKVLQWLADHPALDSR
jgi:hypothetical protein